MYDLFNQHASFASCNLTFLVGHPPVLSFLNLDDDDSMVYIVCYEWFTYGWKLTIFPHFAC